MSKLRESAGGLFVDEQGLRAAIADVHNETSTTNWVLSSYP
jgi:hypothetical protein